MGLVSRAMERRASPSNPDRLILNAFGFGRESATGVTVTERSAMQQSVVFACVRIIAEDVAKLPLKVHRRLRPRGRVEAPEHPLYEVLHDVANAEMTAFAVRETLTSHTALYGNGYAEIEWSDGGEVKGLWPLRPDRTRPVRLDDGRLAYQTDIKGQQIVLPRERVFHLPGLGFDGIRGYSPIDLARESIGLAIALEQFGGTFFGNNAIPGVVLTHPGVLSEEALKNVRESWEERHQGLTRSHRLSVLEEGMKVETIGLAPEHAQFLGSRQYQLPDIARWWRMPLHKVLDYTHSTFSNVEHLGIEYVVDTLLPYLVRWEQTAQFRLMTSAERREYIVKHNVSGLARGDLASRYAAYAVGRQNGWLSADDVRELEDMNELPDGQGQVYLVPLNMVPATELVAGRSAPQATDRAIEAARLLDAPVEARSAEGRRRVRAAWKRVIADAATRTVKREVADVKRAAERYLGRRDAQAFLTWLEEFYREHKAFVDRQFRPVLMGLAEAVQAEAADEANGEAGMTPELEQFVGEEYLPHLIARHVGSSEGQVREVVERALAEGEDPVAALQARFDEWEEKRAEKISRLEAVEASEALAVFVWRGLGVRRLTWRTFGKNCPYCSGLSGRVVGIDQPFLPAGDLFQPEGAERPLVSTNHVRHAPAHEGCDCSVGVA